VVAASYSGDPAYAASSSSTNVSVIGIPQPADRPSISGNTTEGQRLSETHAAWSGSPTSFTYRWQRCNSAGSGCVAINGATSQTYVLAAADVGHRIRVLESATNLAGTGGPADSLPTAPVSRPGRPRAPANTLRPVVSGTTTVGGRLTASPGAWSGTPPLRFSYRWQLCGPRRCVNIRGATGRSLVLRSAFVGLKVRVVVTATNSAGHASAHSSEAGPIRRRRRR
jgi:hypothetical protein